MGDLNNVHEAAIQLAKTGGRAFQITLPPRQYFAVVAEISSLGPLGKWHDYDEDLSCYVGVRCSPFWTARLQLKRREGHYEKVFVDISYDNDLEKDVE